MIQHHRTHWLAVAVVIAIALVAMEAGGQSMSAQAMFEGRPALAGAQAGLGAQAGPPQGGIGLQGTDGAEFNVRKPPVVRDAEVARRAAASDDPIGDLVASLDARRVLPPKVAPDATPAEMRSAARAR